METNFNPLENLAKDLGIDIFDTPPSPEPQPEPSAASSEPNAGDSSLTSDPEPQPQPQPEPLGDGSNVLYTQSGYQDGGGNDDDVSDEETLDFINTYLQENFGTGLETILQGQTQETDIDERLLPILEFVRDTGRSPEDWFRYQMLNPSEMDDLNLIKLQMSAEHPELSQEDISVLIENKYKIGEDFLDEKEQRMAQLQLKIDANKARQEVENLRNGYLARTETGEYQEYEPESFVDEQWLQEMSNEIDALEGIDFELNGEKTFTFGLNDSYKNSLKSKNAQLDSFFDQYVDGNGQWNHELFGMHRTVVDNIDEIVKAVYSQGLSDGQRKVVQNVANVQTGAPNAGPGGQSDTLLAQIESIMGQQDSMVRIKL